MGRGVRIFCLLSLIFALAACSGASECSSVVERAKTCSGTIASIDGSRDLSFAVDDLDADLSVNVEVTISVAGGRLDVTFRTADGRTQRGEASPGSPVRLRGDILLDRNDKAVISLRSNGGAASEVGYTVKLSG